MSDFDFKKDSDESEVVSYNMGGYIYKVAYKQLDKLSDYADANDLVHWFRTAKSLWRKVKASLLIAHKNTKKSGEDDLVSKADDLAKKISDTIKSNAGKPSSAQGVSDKIEANNSLTEDMEAFEQKIYEGMTVIKMWIPTNKSYDDPIKEFEAKFS